MTVPAASVVRQWLQLQGYGQPRGAERLTRQRFTDHLERTGGLQLDSINALDRAHYLTLWSRFGPYDRAELDAWVYDERRAYEYWGHEASLLPITHLPLGLRRMRRFPPEAWKRSAWFARWSTSPASKRRVLRLLRAKGPMERAEIRQSTPERTREDKQSLLVLWHQGRVAVARRRHARKVYDLAERVYPAVAPASTAQYRDNWLLQGLRGNGIASEAHLVNYWTGPRPDAALRRRILARNLKAGRIVSMQVEGFRERFYALPEHLDTLDGAPEPQGTTLLCPFDSFLWQRRRARELLGFDYRLEVYVPATKRVFGYYVCPILHDGRLVGRLDPKMHRASGLLEVKKVFFEAGFTPSQSLRQGLRTALEDLAIFLGATDLTMSRI